MGGRLGSYRGYSNSALLSVRVDPETAALDAPAWTSTSDHIAPTHFEFAGKRILTSDVGVHLLDEKTGQLTQLALCCQSEGSFAAPLATHPGGTLAFIGRPTDGTISTVAVFRYGLDAIAKHSVLQGGPLAIVPIIRDY